MKLLIAGVTALMLSITISGPAWSQAESYPKQRITIVAAFTAGGSVDTIARFVADGLRRKWGEAVIIENRPGASGDIAARYVTRSEADGYTILFTATSLVISQVNPPAPLTFSLSELNPISFTTVSTTMFVVNALNPARSLTELIETSRKKSIVIGTSVAGSAGQITGEYFFNSIAKASAIITPYSRGAAPAVTAILGQHLDALSVAVSDAAPQVKSGALRALAVTSSKRSMLLPEVPTLAEAGFAGFVSHGWTGMFVPAKTDPNIVTKLNVAVNEILSDPTTKKRIEEAGFETNVLSHADTVKFLEQDFDTWKKMLSSAPPQK